VTLLVLVLQVDGELRRHAAAVDDLCRQVPCSVMARRRRRRCVTHLDGATACVVVVLHLRRRPGLSSCLAGPCRTPLLPLNAHHRRRTSVLLSTAAAATLVVVVVAAAAATTTLSFQA